ncbi:MAG: short-chain dehydrogenase [Acidobacteria bacterium]|jgi:NAD(P)-dependent dehydrogenase (short-subunit alcohol dehydrogenase family)|nr:short-chain dehydrogenase [Acidobacteriota bacterium]HJM65683.1 SDR family oxidoreductase [Roseibacillus sp.]
MGLLDDRVAIVTGASSGIGRATALRLAGEGAAVIAIARRGERLKELEKANARIEGFACDVSDHDALAKCVEQTVSQHGTIDILVNNAGISHYERHTESSLEHWRQIQSVNIEAMYVLTKLVATHMIEHRYGRVINISSTQSIASEASVGAYAASKGAINAWSRALAVDLAEYGILVNVVAPGCTHTEMSIIDGVDETESEYFQKWYVGERKIPLARAGTAEEIANAILFLSGDQCTYITGHTLVVDGGLTVTF